MVHRIGRSAVGRLGRPRNVVYIAMTEPQYGLRTCRDLRAIGDLRRWLFHPATTGWYPKKAPQEARPVPVMAHPWPGVPARGRNASGRADACWLPIARGLTPHGLRHSHKTVMEELGTPPKLMDERMGHEDGSVQARYSHITARMRNRLMDELTEQ